MVAGGGRVSVCCALSRAANLDQRQDALLQAAGPEQACPCRWRCCRTTNTMPSHRSRPPAASSCTCRKKSGANDTNWQLYMSTPTANLLIACAEPGSLCQCSSCLRKRLSSPAMSATGAAHLWLQCGLMRGRAADAERTSSSRSCMGGGAAGLDMVSSAADAPCEAATTPLRMPWR